MAQPQNGWHQGKANLAICANIQTSIDVKENYFKVPVHMYTSIILYYIYIILYIHTDPPITHRNIYNYVYVYIYTCTHFYSVSNMYVYIYAQKKKNLEIARTPRGPFPSVTRAKVLVPALQLTVLWKRWHKPSQPSTRDPAAIPWWFCRKLGKLRCSSWLKWGWLRTTVTVGVGTGHPKWQAAAVFFGIGNQPGESQNAKPFPMHLGDDLCQSMHT